MAGRWRTLIGVLVVVALGALCGYQQVRLEDLSGDVDALSGDLDQAENELDRLDRSMPEEVDLSAVLSDLEELRSVADSLGDADSFRADEVGSVIDGLYDLEGRVQSLERCADAIAFDDFPEVWCR